MNTTDHSLNEFKSELVAKAHVYEISLTAEILDGLTDYFRLLTEWNTRLHLVAPCSPAEFATRHILESLILLRCLPDAAVVADIGSGAGLPIVPCLVARPDIRATLFESAKRKAVFLGEALKLTESAASEVVAERFENVQAPHVGFITCRALEKFERMLRPLIEWSPPQATLLLFGSGNLRRKLEELALQHSAIKIPRSRDRFLFIANGDSQRE